MIENAQTAENATATTPEQNPSPEGKTFTQDELNSIVKDRLAREKTKFEETLNTDERLKALEAKEKEVLARELRLEAKDKFKNIPGEMLELLNYDDKEAFDSSVKQMETAIAAYDKLQKENAPRKQFAPINPVVDDGKPPRGEFSPFNPGGSARPHVDSLDDAFAPPKYR